MEKNTFNELLKNLNIEATDDQYEKLIEYYNLLISWNEKINLTSITDKQEVFIKHFYDSLSINQVVDLTQIDTLCDIGTGAGFPGIVLKIMFPNIEITLVDSLTKRIKFLEEVKTRLKLDKLNIVNSRAEDFARKNREQYDIVTSRAVAKLNVLLEISFSLVKVNSYFIAMKSTNYDEEIKLSTRALKELNGTVERIEQLELPIINETRTLIRIKKNEKTKEKYPREFKQISKKPL